jgi:archaetidylinositol phosphate synthase
VDRDVRVVVLGFGELPDPVHECEGLDEVLELERTLERIVDLAPALRDIHGASMPRTYHRTMVLCPEREPLEAAPPAPLAVRARKERSHRELLTQRVLAPLGRLVVALLIPLRVSPIAVVLSNGIAGLGAAAAIAQGDLVTAAVLLQLKSVLDNVDGQLARATGRTSALGRYLDTEVDLVANVALTAALGYETGSWLLAAGALLAMTLLLSADYNADVLYRRARGRTVVTEPSAEEEGRLARVLARLYRIVYGSQDRALQGMAQRRLERVLWGSVDEGVRERVALAYHDRFTVLVLSNVGLSTQLAALGVALVVGAPAVFLWAAIGAVALLPMLQFRRETLARRALRSAA